MSNAISAVNAIEILSTSADRIIVSISLEVTPRLVERELSRKLKPYRMPKTPAVRQGVELMAKSPALTAAGASRSVCGNDSLTRRIAYWASKVISGGAR
jgi:hypothetical protein